MEQSLSFTSEKDDLYSTDVPKSDLFCGLNTLCTKRIETNENGIIQMQIPYIMDNHHKKINVLQK